MSKDEQLVSSRRIPSARSSHGARGIYRTYINFRRFLMDLDVDVYVMLFCAACIIILMYIGL